MAASIVEFFSDEELHERKRQILKDAGKSIMELLDGEYHRTLSTPEYEILEELRGIEFLLGE